MADQLCALADVRTQLRFDVTYTTDDAYLTALIEGVTDWIQGTAVRRVLVPKTAETWITDTAAGSEIAVRRGIRTITSLTIAASDQPDTGGVWPTTIAASLIALRPPALDRPDGMPATSIVILGSSPVLSDAINGARIVGDFGPAATPLRAARVAVDAVVAAYVSRRAGVSGVIGADAASGVPWATYFADGSPQARTLEDLRGPGGIA